MVSSKTLIYKKLPTGAPVVGEHLAVESREVDIDHPPKGGLVLEVLYASYDPYLRGKMRDPSIKSYSPAFEVDQPIYNTVVAKVLKSDSPEYVEGELVKVLTFIAEYVRIEDPVAANVTKINNPFGLEIGMFLGPLGMPGLTAWSSLHKIGQPRSGETIFISSAAGAVGQIVGQVAQREGLKVIGSVGSDEKLDYIINELGFDAGFNYKKEKPLDALKRLAPNGIDIYYDNVGGEHLEAALEVINVEGRIVACGSISDYNVPFEERKGIRNTVHFVFKRLFMQGFLVGMPGFGPAYAKEHQEKLQQWLADGTIKAKLSVTEGIDHAAEGFVGMLEGRNFGKAVLKIK